MIRQPTSLLLDNDESNDWFAKKTPIRHPADLRIQLLLNWSNANILLSLIAMCLQFKGKVGTPRVLHAHFRKDREVAPSRTQ